MNNINDNFVSVPNQIIEDDRLTWKAKGIFTQLMSMENGSNISINLLTYFSSDGKTSVRSGIQELIKYGYLERHRIIDSGGYNGGWKYVIKLPR